MSVCRIHQVSGIHADRRTADAIISTLLARVETTRVAIAETSPRLLRTALAVRRRYADLDLDPTETATVALIAEHRTDVVLTMDRRDFRTMRPLTGHEAFRLLPDDL